MRRRRPAVCGPEPVRSPPPSRDLRAARTRTHAAARSAASSRHPVASVCPKFAILSRERRAGGVWPSTPGTARRAPSQSHEPKNAPGGPGLRPPSPGRLQRPPSPAGRGEVGGFAPLAAPCGRPHVRTRAYPLASSVRRSSGRAIKNSCRGAKRRLIQTPRGERLPEVRDPSPRAEAGGAARVPLRAGRRARPCSPSATRAGRAQRGAPRQDPQTTRSPPPSRDLRAARAMPRCPRTNPSTRTAPTSRGRRRRSACPDCPAASRSRPPRAPRRRKRCRRGSPPRARGGAP